jgi:hypothetical protein
LHTAWYPEPYPAAISPDGFTGAEEMVFVHMSTESLECAEPSQRVIERIGTDVPDRGFVILRLSAMDGSRVIELYQPEVIIGRHSRADIRIPCRDVSRRHCRLVFESGQWYVEDLGSLNGTYVNDEAVQRALLPPNSLLRVARHSFVVTWPQLDTTVDCPNPEAHLSELPDRRARQVLESIAEQLPEQTTPA